MRTFDIVKSFKASLYRRLAELHFRDSALASIRDAGGNRPVEVHLLGNGLDRLDDLTLSDRNFVRPNHSFQSEQHSRPDLESLKLMNFSVLVMSHGQMRHRSCMYVVAARAYMCGLICS